MRERATISNCHKPGVTNFVADILSRDTNLPINILKFAILTLFPNQVPDSLKAVNLKNEIDSELASLMQLVPNAMASPINIKRSNAGRLLGGCASSKEMVSTILGLKNSTKESAPSCCPLPRKVSEKFEYGTRALTCLRASTVSSAISDIRTTFRSHFRDDPGLEENGNGKMALLLKRQLDGYKNEDPPPGHQKALPVRIFKYLLKIFNSKTEEAIGQMTTVAFSSQCEVVSTALSK